MLLGVGGGLTRHGPCMARGGEWWPEGRAQGSLYTRFETLHAGGLESSEDQKHKKGGSKL